MAAPSTTAAGTASIHAEPTATKLAAVPRRPSKLHAVATSAADSKPSAAPNATELNEQYGTIVLPSTTAKLLAGATATALELARPLQAEPAVLSELAAVIHAEPVAAELRLQKQI